jgi:type I restriction enzyme M protein
VSKDRGFRNRQGETLFIDARNIGAMIDRTHKELSVEDIKNIGRTYHQWRSSSTLTPTLSQGEREFVLPSTSGRGAGGEGKKKPALPEQLLSHARELRTNQTDAEKLLWQLLRNRRIEDTKFRRQHPVNNYILDFYCNALKLAIELDGSQHLEEKGKAYDEKRTQTLNQHGIKVLRFDNRQMLLETEAVLEVIYNEIIARSETLTPALSQGERATNPPLPSGEGLGVRAFDAYQDIAGYCKSATLEDIKANDYVLTPGRYVGAAPLEDDGIPFETKMTELSQTLFGQMKESEKLDAVIRKNLEVLGYGE